ncbi:hypothetical protein [Coxiella-like endosymbiont]|uniref:hypothetical protein n=1 Tax=Coxiella-like endosymbiont TaxID=1592897 RepID=UPI00272C1B6A|nr:hypothetical protein [Coxiella-like endosymbiont]
MLATIGTGDIEIQSVLNRLRASEKTPEPQTFLIPLEMRQTKISPYISLEKNG